MEPIAVLTSGGLDSCVMLADLARTRIAHPIYVQAGLAWEAEERKVLEAYIAALRDVNVRPLTTLSVPVAPMYGRHWSITGEGVPGADAPDRAVFLPGRNILLIGLAAVWCSTHDTHEIAIGSLEANPFPDASPEFFDLFGRALTMGLGHDVRVVAPYRGLFKSELIRRNAGLPLELSLTCANPRNGVHCGDCNKCAERHGAFIDAGVTDKTRYAKPLEGGRRHG
ncbi:MAG: 7-cyano-7-deazaguanine synthase [SAR202 cluster bacterium]|nr:7-cyano-7-deazaguanine synthase [SAR202 cluster bacterium]